MVFSAAGYTNTTTGNNHYVTDKAPEPETPIVDAQGYPAYMAQLSDKHDPVKYTMYNAPLIGLAGLVSGFQEAFYRFEKMPPAVSRQTFNQALKLYSIVGGRTLYAAGIGAIFCYADATISNMRGGSDMTGGMMAGAIAGLAFGGFKPLPQPIFWPLAFAGAAATADVFGSIIPKNLAGFKAYGTVPGRENWSDPEPPRPPIMDTSAAVRPHNGKHFWRGN